MKKTLIIILLVIVYFDIILVGGLSIALIVLGELNVYSFGLLRANGTAVFVIFLLKILMDFRFWYFDQIKQRYQKDE